ncbi:fimbria/pilus periplasmic chaperone [Yersinia sp. 2545 StPb PI]|uniref:fimbria/pilus periplasmic chaperone n=1 Tax=unclassified Yersinia (in: enterobacteria) TaxID=2653513 RepID=UPI003FA467BB
MFIHLYGMKENKKTTTKRPILSGLLLFLGCTAQSFAVQPPVPVESTTQPFTLKLGATRVIYDPTSAGATLVVSNPQAYPILVRSAVLAEDRVASAPFMVTPPLFRLEGQQQSRLRVVKAGGQLASDRESLYWLCVTGVPPKGDEAWAEGQDGKPALPQKSVNLNIQLSVQSCIKLFVRPSGLGQPSNTASTLTWTRKGEQLDVNNPTPFYMNLKSVRVGDKAVENITHVPPFSSRQFTLPKGGGGQVQWQVITDLGGESRIFSSTLS